MRIKRRGWWSGQLVARRGLPVLVSVLALLMMAVPAGASPAGSGGSGSTAPGTLAGTVDFSQPCSSGIGVGVAYDGSNLWYSCYGSSPDLFRADPVTGQVTASYDIAGGLGALAYDASRNAIWAGWAGGPEGDVYLIQLDASKSVVGSKVAFNTCGAGECYINIDDGLTYDAGSGTLYLSPDTATTIDHFDTSGTLLGSFGWAGQGCYNSGLAIGDQLLLEGSDGCSHIWVMDRTDPSKVVFDFSTAVAGDPNFRDEGMACDPNTFAGQGEQVIWSKEAYSPMRAHAFVIPNGSCGVGGEPVTQTSYVALGDSYSSGEGNPPFLSGTDQPGDYCHRSDAAYPEVLAGMLGAQLKFYACSGATTANITTTRQYPGEPTFQLGEPGVDATAGLVTLTIGGNDAGFSAVLKTCIEQKLKANAVNAVAGWLGFGQDPSCADSSSFVASTNRQIDNVGPAVTSTYQAILNQVDPTNTSVIAAGYPHLFPTSTSAQDCVQLSPYLTNADQNYLNGEADRLDGVLGQSAEQAGVNFVDVRAAFDGHDVCGGSGAWINGLSIASGSGGGCTFAVLGHCVIPGLPIVGSFHPDASGHSHGYAAALNSFIQSAPTKTPAGLPTNPIPPLAPLPRAATTSTDSAATDSSSVGVGDLTVLPVTAGTAACEGTYQAGQQLQVSGDGFTPSATVALYASSPGLGSSDEQQVGQATADANGHLVATIRLPLTATGFTQPGSAAGLVFLDALGTGTAAAHYDDMAATGLAPHGGTCGTVDTLPFAGFDPPVNNPPEVNSVHPGRAIPVKFAVSGADAPLSDVLAAGYPQSAPVSCTNPASLTSGEPTTLVGNPDSTASDNYNYVWKTDSSWTGCRELIVGLVDGSYHRALFDFGS